MSEISQQYLKDKDGNIFSPIVSMDSVYANGGSLLDFFYPVGTYYETSDANFNPNEQWRRRMGRRYNRKSNDG